MTALEAKLRTSAMANAALLSLLGTGSPVYFRWFDTQLPEGSTLPAVVALLIADSTTYSATARMATSFARVQLTVWGGQGSAGAASADTVRDAILSWLDSMNLIGISGLVSYPNFVLMDRRGVFPRTDGPIYQRVLDVNVFSNDTLT
jgi:hypothetical protein